jgi:hypothetical protein
MPVSVEGRGEFARQFAVSPSLPERMVARADADGLPADHILRIRAAQFEKWIDVEAPGWSAANFVGAWARARRAWCDYTGDSLI